MAPRPLTIKTLFAVMEACFHFLVTATNSFGASAPATSAPTSAVTSSGGSCPFAGAGYADGCAGAPVATIQRANILSSYTNRPPWNVAGIDYAVGIPTGTALTDWRTLSNPCLSVNTSTGLITITCDVTIDKVDFSDSFAPGTSPGSAVLYNPSGGANNITITNSNFKNSTHNANYQNSFELNELNHANVTFKYDKFDGINTDGIQGGGFSAFTATSGNATYMYNWFINSTQQSINTNPNMTSGTTTTVKYNLFDNMYFYSGAHRNYVQRSGHNITLGLDYEFNTTYQYGPGGGEGFQYNDCCPPNLTVTLANPTLANNTMIALPNQIPAPGFPAGAATISTFVHGPDPGNPISGTGQNNQNYFDRTGLLGDAYYHGTMTPSNGWSSSGNIDMNTGATIVPGPWRRLPGVQTKALHGVPYADLHHKCRYRCARKRTGESR
jgi:hypothetical protein